MGRLSNVDGHVFGHDRHGHADRLVLCHSRNRLHLHARLDGYRRRPLDTRSAPVGILPPAGWSTDARHRLCGAAGAPRPPLPDLRPLRSLLHAHARPEQLRGLQRTDTGRDGHRQAFPAHPRLRHHRFHLYDVAGRCAGVPGQPKPVCGLRRGQPPPLPLHFHAAPLPRGQERREEVGRRRARTACLRPAQTEEDGHFLLLLDAPGRESADHQRLRQPLYHLF